jgi:hypothetical protein
MPMLLRNSLHPSFLETSYDTKSLIWRNPNSICWALGLIVLLKFIYHFLTFLRMSTPKRKGCSLFFLVSSWPWAGWSALLGEEAVNYADSKNTIDSSNGLDEAHPSAPLPAAEKKRGNKRRALLIEKRLKSIIRSTISATPTIRLKHPHLRVLHLRQLRSAIRL